jgi:HEPN domain-containing protein
MLERKDIKNLAKARHEDARVLLLGKRYESAMYLCGYAIELSLKARICRTLKWVGYPATAREFEDYKSFKTHNLNVLLRLSGIDDKVKKTLFTEWTAVAQWTPESRYRRTGMATPAEAALMIASTEVLLRKL